jgi:type I restriction enzyme, S subunit
MFIPKGYKQTDVGVIPNDWNVNELQNLVNITTGAKNTQDKIDDGDYPFFVRSQTVEKINSYSFDGEAVLTAGDGVGTGKIFHYIKGKFDYHQRVYKMSEFSDKIDGYYFYLYFSQNFYNRIMQMTAKSSVDSVRREMIANMQIPLPPTKAEQIAIAEVLSDTDDLITILEKLIVKKQNIKKGALQNLLTPKEDWEKKTLGDICEIKDGTHQTPIYYDSGIPFYSVENVTKNDFINTKFISTKEHNLLSNNRKIVKGDILMTRIGSIGVCKYVDWDVDASFYVSLALLKLKKNYSAKFICQYSHCSYFKREIELNSLLFAYPKKINLGQIGKVNVIIPKTIEEQARIATILSDMDKEIEGLETKLEKTKMIKQGMMQELLTGRTRLV